MATPAKPRTRVLSKAPAAHISRPFAVAPAWPDAPECDVALAAAVEETTENDEKRLLRIDVHDALRKSLMLNLDGLPFPVQFRNRGALEAWRSALGATPEGMAIGQDWSGPGCVNSLIREEILGYCAHFHHGADTDPFAKIFGGALRLVSLACSTNLMFELHGGTIIETTPALETLLAYSDIDLSLPVSMVAPPFQAQYVRFGETASRLLPAIMPSCIDTTIDGAFVFMSTPSPDSDMVAMGAYIELVFIGKEGDCYDGHISIGGWTNDGARTVNDWVDSAMAAAGRSDEEAQAIKPYISYVLKVLLYMTLKEARRVPHAEYSALRARIERVASKKRAKLIQRMASRYDGIVVGPASVSATPATPMATDTCERRAAHWRRGHFRMQAHGPSNQLRKLIFIAPLLVHAGELGQDAPRPRKYSASLQGARNRA